MMRVVCINKFGWSDDYDMDTDGPEYGDIDIVEGVEASDGEDYLYLMGYNEIDPIEGRESFLASEFRPISDCGETICEWIEETHFKEIEYQEALKTQKV
jgi:hypothetical protein